MEKKISKATMSRFPVYLKALRKMQHEGKETCLSSELFEITGIQDTTIRRDVYKRQYPRYSSFSSP